MTTRKRWAATRRYTTLGESCQPWAGSRGYVYEPIGFIVAGVSRRSPYIVHIANGEAQFQTLKAAETYLWHEWVKGEIDA